MICANRVRTVDTNGVITRLVPPQSGRLWLVTLSSGLICIGYRRPGGKKEPRRSRLGNLWRHHVSGPGHTMPQRPGAVAIECRTRFMNRLPFLIAMLTMSPAPRRAQVPTINNQPASRAVGTGASAVFAVGVRGRSHLLISGNTTERTCPTALSQRLVRALVIVCSYLESFLGPVG